MKNIRKSLNRLIALVLVFFLSLESFGAQVSDNDGAAFISKAEFDSMKNSFQTTINEFNSQIDDKISYYISSYISGIKLGKETILNNNYKSMSIPGNKDKVILWSSKNNVTFCTANTQKLAYDYTYVQGYAYNGVGTAGQWHAVLDSETQNRCIKRFNVNKDGYIDGRYKWKFWIAGCMAGVIFLNRTGTGGTWHSNIVLNTIDSRNTKAYVGCEGDGSTTNNWYATYTYMYYEQKLETNENIGIYPLSETDGEQVVDDQKQEPTITSGSAINIGPSSEFAFSGTGEQLGTYPTMDWGNAADNIDQSISNIFTKYKLSNFKYKDFYDKNKLNDKIKCGIAIATANANAKITIKGKCDYDGYVILYNNANADELWCGQRSSVTDLTTWKITDNYITANTEWTRELTNVKKGDGIFILYLPSDTSKLGKMEIKEIKQQE